MLAQVENTVRRHTMFLPGQRVAVAVSGGADSVCLLHVLAELSGSLGIELAVAHLNHGLRGDDSDQDQEFVRELATRLNLPFYTEAVNVASVGGNLEQSGRDARRSFFLRLIQEGAVDRIATAHTSCDQAETVIFRLLRGSGTAGLSGILPVTREGLVRPLLDCTRTQVMAFLTERALDWREDRTNHEPVYARNRIRHELLPLVEQQYSPAVKAILAATAVVARDEEDFWTSEVAVLAQKFLHIRGEAALIEASVLSSLHVALARRLIRGAVAVVKGDLRGIDIAHVDRILTLATQNEGSGRLQVPGLDVFRSFEWLRIARPRVGSRWDHNYCVPVGDDFPQRLVVSSATAICLELLDRSVAFRSYNDQLGELDRDVLAEPLELRNWQPGDEISPVGRSKVKVKQLFQEARVPIWERHGWPVITSGGVLVWTRRFGVSGDVACTPSTSKVLRIYEVDREEAPEVGSR